MLTCDRAIRTGRNRRREDTAMKVSFFETGRYAVPPDLPREWPVPPAAYDPELGAEAFQGMVERARFVEKLGFDWISLSEHHYSPRILTPSPPLSAAFLASQVDTIKIALLGADRAGQQPDPGRRGIGDARHDAPGPLRVRPVARHHQRISQLRSEPEGGARAHRRGDGADPEGVERAAAVRLAGALFPVPHRVDLAAPADAALPDRPTRSGSAPRRPISPRGTASGSASPTARSS